MFPAHRLLSIVLLFAAAQALAPSDATASTPGVPNSPVVPYAAPACNHTFSPSPADSRGDVDGDGVPDNIDVCPNTPPGVAVDAVGRPLGDLDADCDTDLDDFALFQQGFTGPLSPLGACCDTATGECIDDVPAEDCLPPLDFSPDQLCDELDPPCIAEGYGVLYAPSHPDNPTFRAQLSAMLGEPVDYYDPRSDTPTLEELLPYRAVFTWANYAYDDLYAFSAVLLEYVEAGRTLIMGQWSYDAMYGTPTFPSPLIESEYCPVDTSYYTSAVYDGNGTDCAYTTGLVDQLSAEYFDICSPRPGMVTDGTAEGGAFPMLIWYPDRRVYYSPGNTGETVTDGDWVELTYGMVVCDD